MSTELDVKIPLTEGKYAYGRLRGSWNQPLVIFAHGLFANRDRVMPYAMSKLLNSHEVSFLRFNFYGREQNARKLIACTPETHARDLLSIVQYARDQGAREVHMAGHSFGGLAILLAKDLNADSAILIDPSHPSVDPLTDAAYVPELDLYRTHSKGLDLLVGGPMINHFHNLQPESYLSSYSTPSLIISAAASKLTDGCKQYVQALKPHAEVKLQVITGADHAFTSDEALDQLLAHSLDWLKSRTA